LPDDSALLGQYGLAGQTILEKRATPTDRTQGIDLADDLLDVHNPVFLA